MKALVTGGAGFIGSHLVRALLSLGHGVVVMDNLSSGTIQNLEPEAEFYEGDVRNREFVMSVMDREKPEMIWHLAAQASVTGSLRDPVGDASINILGTLNILDAAVKYQAQKVIYASTAAVYGNPETLPINEQHPIVLRSGYAISKYCAEQYLKAYHSLYGLDYTILRYANVFGPRQKAGADGGVVAVFINNLYHGREMEIFGDGEQTRDFIYIKDVVAANLEAGIKGSGEVLNIGNGSSISINQLCEIMLRLSGAQMLAKYHSERAGDIRHSRLDNRAARNALKWEPMYTVEEGLRETIG